jgi:2-oxoisovalerate dehydrogenase E2 component (dihydrolipoyl transacylase)
MRARVQTSDKDNDRWLEIRRDGIIGVAVSGISHPLLSHRITDTHLDPKNGLLTPSLPPLPPSTAITSLTSHISKLRADPTRPSPLGSTPSITISSVGSLGECTGAMPVLPPGGGLAICAVGRAKWEMEYTMRDAGLKASREDVERGGMRAVLRCPVGWSGDHRVVSANFIVGQEYS